MKGITYCGACADYDIKKHRCKCGAKLESNPQDKFFDDCPLPDAVPVVRCKDCKYWQDNNDNYPHEECRWGHGETPDADDFCSYGERREK